MTTAAPPTPSTAPFSRLMRDSALYSVGTFVGKAAALLVLPVTTRVLGPEAFGRVEVLSTLMSALTSVLILGLDVAVTRTYPDLDETRRRRLFGSWLVIGIALTVPLAVGLVVGGGQVSDLLLGSSDHSVEVALVGLFVVASTVRAIALTALRNQERPVPFAFVSAGTLLVNAVLVVWLLQIDGAVRSVLLANVGSTALGAVLGVAATRRVLTGRPDRGLATTILRLGIPLVPAAAAVWLGEVLHRTILLGVSSEAEVGYFAVAVRFSSITLLVILGFQAAWQPRAFAALDRPDGLQTIARDGWRIMVVVALSAVGIAVVVPDALVLVSGDEFAAAAPATGWMLVFALLFGVYQVMTMPSAIDRRLGDIGVTSVIGIAAAVVTNVVLAPTFGGAGTAAAMATGQLVAVLSAIGLGRHRARVPFAVVPLLVLTGVAAGAILASTIGPDGVAVRATTTAVFVGVAVALGGVRCRAQPARAVFGVRR